MFHSDPKQVKPLDEGAVSAAKGTAGTLDTIILDRYRILKTLGKRVEVERFLAEDIHSDPNFPSTVILVREPIDSETSTTSTMDNLECPNSDSEDGNADHTEPAGGIPLLTWPGLQWERLVLERFSSPIFPVIVGHFTDERYVYLVFEGPIGRPLREAWNDSELSNQHKIRWLIELAEGIHLLHREGMCMIRRLHPESIHISFNGQPILIDLSSMIPLNEPIQLECLVDPYQAPELTLDPKGVDCRADLFTFGALIYSLLLNRNLDEDDRLDASNPAIWFQHFPDHPPELNTLLGKTYQRDVEARFPSTPYTQTDSSGFLELLDYLHRIYNTIDRFEYDVGIASSIGMLRGRNQDAVSVTTFQGSRKEHSPDALLLTLADGMGGMADGELAAEMATQVVRDGLIKQSLFELRLNEPVMLQPTRIEGFLPVVAVEADSGLRILAERSGDDFSDHPGQDWTKSIQNAVTLANEKVFNYSMEHSPSTGMGTTLEVLLIQGSELFLGHVGDSRTYLLRDGRMTQLTEDQTWVAALVRDGLISRDEAENHPRRSELQQAVGGRPDINVEVKRYTLRSGDVLLICSDGLTGCLREYEIAEELRTDRTSRQIAKRLINRANSRWASDNVSVVILKVS
jgi:PPM family protein phosphatase